MWGRQVLVILTFFLIISLIPFTLAEDDRVEESGERKVLWLELSGYVSPGMADYVKENIAKASEYSAVLITLDTFGGLGSSMFDIIDAILDSPVPVIGYVYPAGKQALSAGTYILMATDYAAMAPHTIIGSAQPVAGGQPVNDTKIINFLVAKMGTLAEIHGRNKTQAIRFITHNDNLGPEDALRLGVIEAFASSPEELLEKADGAVITRLGGEAVIDVKGAELVKLPPSIRSQVVSILSDPLISSLLISIGILVLILGFTSPGFGAEIAGGVMILLGLLGQGFNVNIIGILLAAIGAGLIIFELYSPGFGGFGIGGVITLGIGLVLLIGYPPEPLYISEEWIREVYTLIAAGTITGGVFFIFLIYKALRIQRKKSYLETLPTSYGRAVDDIAKGREGYVIIAGEYWRAVAKEDVKKGENIKVVEKRGGFVVVQPAGELPEKE